MTLEAANRTALARGVVESAKGGYGGATVFRTGVPRVRQRVGRS